MKNRKLQLLSTSIVLFLLNNVKAQTTMYVKETSGSTTSYPLPDINKLTFSSGNMLVNQSSGNIAPYTLNNISRYTFSHTATGITKVKDEELHSLFIYPNPATTEIHFNYQALEVRTVTIDIIDLKGNVVEQIKEISKKGKNSILVNVSKLTNGLYLFRIQNGYDVETINFLKS